MQYSVGVEYAIHCLLYLVDVPMGRSIGIKDLAAYQGVSESYLSKVFTKLKKSGVVKSVPGVNGGYELANNLGILAYRIEKDEYKGKEFFVLALAHESVNALKNIVTLLWNEEKYGLVYELLKKHIYDDCCDMYAQKFSHILFVLIDERDRELRTKTRLLLDVENILPIIILDY